MSNGGVIGADNRATVFAAPGVWTLDEVYNFRLQDNWPNFPTAQPTLMDVVFANASNGVQGFRVNDQNFIHPVGNTDGRFTANTSTDVLTIISSGFPDGHSLSVDDELFFTEGSPGDLPNPLTSVQPYYVETVVSSTEFKVASSIGGPAIDLLSVGTDTASRQVFKRPKSTDPTIDIEIYHFSASAFPSGYTLTSLLELGEDVDADDRLTAVVIDKDFVLDTDGILKITNDRRRFGLVVASKQNIQIGPGQLVSPQFRDDTGVRGNPTFRRYQLERSSPFANGYLRSGGNGGNGGSNLTPRQGFYQFMNVYSGAGGGNFGGAGGLNSNPAAFTETHGLGTKGGDGRNSTPASSGVHGGGGGGGNSKGLRIVNNAGPSTTDGEENLHNTVILHASDISLPGPLPFANIDMRGGNGGTANMNAAAPAPPSANFGGGAGGGNVYIYHSGSYSNSGTISVAGGVGNPVSVPVPTQPRTGQPGTSGNIVVQPI